MRISLSARSLSSLSLLATSAPSPKLNRTLGKEALKKSATWEQKFTKFGKFHRAQKKDIFMAFFSHCEIEDSTFGLVGGDWIPVWSGNRISWRRIICLSSLLVYTHFNKDIYYGKSPSSSRIPCKLQKPFLSTGLTPKKILDRIFKCFCSN